MPSLDDPFKGIDRALLNTQMGGETAAIIVDFHGEATSEKVAMGHMLDGRVSAVIGTHSHIPTADHQILPGGTGYITDLGMCGDYDSVIGMKPQAAISRFIDKNSKEYARGLSSFSSFEIVKIMGHHSNEIEKLLGYISKSEVVHKDDMVEI